jgi:hypothetical protein
VALYRRGRWTWLLVAVNAVLGLAFTVPIVVLLWTQQLLNPVLLEELGWQDAFQPGRTPMIAVTVAFAAILVWSIVDSIVKTVRADRLARTA